MGHSSKKSNNQIISNFNFCYIFIFSNIDFPQKVHIFYINSTFQRNWYNGIYGLETDIIWRFTTKLLFSKAVVQLFSVTGNQLEKTEKFRSEGMASEIIKARKEILILLYNLIRHKFNNSNSSQSKDQKQNKVNEFFNIQYGKLIPVVLHSKLCRHDKK